MPLGQKVLSPYGFNMVEIWKKGKRGKIKSCTNILA
jgi:hypothetical protein